MLRTAWELSAGMLSFVVAIAIGWWFGGVLDRWLGTKPLFTVGLVVLGLVGEFLRFWYDYDARMKVLEAQRAASVRAPSSQGDRP